jgi:hypothetical protein
MAGAPEDHLTDSRDLYVLVEGDEWRMWRPLIPTPVTGPAGLRNSSTGGRGARSRDRAVVPSAAELVEQRKEIARLASASRMEAALSPSGWLSSNR